MPYPIRQNLKKNAATFITIKKFLSNEDCKNIIALQDKIKAEPGEIAGASTKRISEIRWVNWTEYSDSLFTKLAGIVAKANIDFGFSISGFDEPLQLTHYYSNKNGHYDWHEDRCDVGPAMNRKISGTLLLNDDYEGGEFELFDTNEQPKLSRGDLILFPSYKVHRVKPITMGERWSLVFWVSGPPFV